MGNELVIDNVKWYDELLFDLKKLSFEGIVKTKHAIGKRIIEDELNFGKPEYGSKQIENLAKDMSIGKTEIYCCIQFAKKYELSDVSENLTWHEIEHKLLPKAHVAHASGENEWYTPSEYIEAARKVMGGIDLDPASSDKANKVVKAKKYWTEKENGLTETWAWYEGRVWMNPPYAQPLITQFCNKLALLYSCKEITEACVLVNNATETEWFQIMLDVASAICLIKGRIKFIDTKGESSGAPLQGQVVLYMGEGEKDFAEEFTQFGKVVFCERAREN